jgi:hypothetical protein
LRSRILRRNSNKPWEQEVLPYFKDFSAKYGDDFTKLHMNKPSSFLLPVLQPLARNKPYSYTSLFPFCFSGHVANIRKLPNWLEYHVLYLC